MRMTNKIMQNNSLYNINRNKILQDKLSNQMATNKKITRPSDDPVIAIRALRLRSTVSELTQFYKKNIPDANSWLDVTGDALSTVTQVITDLMSQANRAANKDWKMEDLKIFIEQMRSLGDEFYSTGNVDYAGRYIFTGYRTDTTLTFTSEVEEDMPSYEITEQTTLGSFDTVNYTDVGDLEGMDKNNYEGKTVTEQDVSNSDIHRLRLAYDNLSGTNQTATENGAVDAPVNVEIVGAGMTIQTTTVSSSDDPYKQIQEANEDGKELAIFIPETGEILFSDASYKKISEAAEGLDNLNTEVRVTYTKDDWKEGDLRPEHYFACTERKKDENGDFVVKQTGTDDEGNAIYGFDGINYNAEYLDGKEDSQTIEYDVGYNQKIQVNTRAYEVFGHGLDRDIDDLERALNSLAEIDATKNDLEEILNGLQEGTDEYADVLKKYEAAEKAYSYIRENIHNMFEHAITKMQGYLDQTNLAITNNGTRSQRLELIENRLMDQKTTFETLKSENEDADLAESVVQLTSTELTYNAALMATGKIMQTSLMNYI